MTISVKNVILRRFRDADLSRGILRSLRHSFYADHPTAFPYRSVRLLLKSLDWPQDYMELDEYPKDKERPWTNIIQGLAHDGNNWYIAQADSPGVNLDPDLWVKVLGIVFGLPVPLGRVHWHWPAQTVNTLWKLPVGFDLNADFSAGHLPHGVIRTGKPAGPMFQAYSHFGSLDYRDGKLYIPVEAADHDTHRPKVMVYDAETLEFSASADMVDQAKGHASWCAVNPLKGLLYSSGEMDADPETGHLHVYEPAGEGDHFTLTYLGSFTLYDERGTVITLKRLQGGVFSQDGQLYLVIDTRDEHAGIHGFDMLTGRRVFHKQISYNKDNDPAGGEELEGITLWDLQSGAAPHISGELHIFRRDIDASLDNVYFKHFKEIRGRSLSFAAPIVVQPKSSTDRDLSDHYGLSTEMTFSYVGEPFAAGQPGLPMTRRFALLTYNIAQIPFGLYEGVRDKFQTLEDIAEYLETNGYDIVCLQEAFDVATPLINAIGTLRYHAHGPKGTTWGTIAIPDLINLSILFELNSGLLILSRFPIVSHHAREYSAKSGLFTADGHAAKGILHARIQIGTEAHQTIDVFTSHTQSGDTPDEMRIRFRQFVEARKFIKAHRIQDCWVLAGDLNVVGDPSIVDFTLDDYPDLANEYAVMLSLLGPLHPMDLWTACYQIDHDPGYTFDEETNHFKGSASDPLRQRLDYIIVPRSARIQRE